MAGSPVKLFGSWSADAPPTVLHDADSPGTVATRLDVADALAARHGRALRVAATVDGIRSLVYWSRNGGGDVDYLRPEHHTLSVYIQGGGGVRERGTPLVRGSPGAICVLPAGHESRWYNDAEVGVLHVYFDDADIEALTGVCAPPLRQVHFGRDALLHRLGQCLVDDVGWSGAAERLIVEQLVRAMLARLVSGSVNDAHSPGLSARSLARVEARLSASVDESCTLAELADDAGLGIRQFTRRYKAATGTTPGQRLLAIRIEHAQRLIRAGQPLAEVALATGFSSQSHLTRQFRKVVGITPGRWRHLL